MLARQALAPQVQQWPRTPSNGDLAGLTELPDGHPLRERIPSTRDSCTGTRCAEYARAPWYRPAGAARRQAELVVVNHHLLLANLALKEEGTATSCRAPMP